MLNWFARRMHELQKAKRDEKGFTLIELLVVVIIIGILAAIAIPTFLRKGTGRKLRDVSPTPGMPLPPLPPSRTSRPRMAATRV